MAAASPPSTERSRVEEHVVALAREMRGRERPRVCFLGTAAGDYDAWIARFHDLFADIAETSHLELFATAYASSPSANCHLTWLSTHCPCVSMD